jgi:uncharacterized BrkB/YihY/UPF0761 family membrane protein
VVSIAAGVTFFALLAMFPAIAALVSIYGIFADPGTIRVHLDDLSSVLPCGAIEVIGDQLTRVASGGKTHARGDFSLHARTVPLERQCRNEGALRRPQYCL